MNSIEKVGSYLAIFGATSLACIFVAVMLNGGWPDSFAPIRALFRLLGDTIGDAAIVVEGLIFIGPGLLVRALGTKIREKNERLERITSGK